MSEKCFLLLKTYLFDAHASRGGRKGALARRAGGGWLDAAFASRRASDLFRCERLSGWRL